jgi:integrase
MAKGSVRKKGKKWYYRFYVEDASGNLVQKEFAGTENKSETEKLLRQAMEDYEAKRFVAKAENITLGELLDLWAEEELKTGTLSNGTVGNYLQTIGRIKQHPISKRKLKTVTSVHLQEFMDLLSFGGTVGDFISKGYSIDYVRSFSAVLQQSFRFAVFPKQFITFNPMQYVVMRHKKEETDLFADETATDRDKVKPLSFEMYRRTQISKSRKLYQKKAESRQIHQSLPYRQDHSHHRKQFLTSTYAKFIKSCKNRIKQFLHSRNSEVTLKLNCPTAKVSSKQKGVPNFQQR